MGVPFQVRLSAVALFEELQQMPQSLTQNKTEIKIYISFHKIPAFAEMTKLF